AWHVPGVAKPIEMSGLSTAAGQKVEEFSTKSKTFDAMRKGCYDSAERLRDMDIDGVDAQVCFPTLPGLAGASFLEIEDKAYTTALIRAYNDWLVDVWCAPDPARIIGAAILPLYDLEESAREIGRVAERGIKCISLPSSPATIAGVKGFPDPAWAPVWDAMSETGLPAEIHIVSGRSDTSALQQGGGSVPEVFVCLAPSTNMTTVATLLFSGILRKWPKLKFISAESGIGWLPYFLERADYTHRKHQFWTGTKIDVTPSELFRQSIYANFISDRAGIELREMIGVENIMLGTDYPHTDSSWPDTQRVIKEQMGDLPDEDRYKICAGNAIRVFNL
ncbi:MAG TPA: amidohydrolase family protein, partial [Actinomycetota bacterium]|nr:amidohydrolase family protein [Actinomycetota bacterium]